jgi:hypothetical protein
LKPDLEKPLGLGLEREPPAGLPGPPKLGLGFQPGAALRSVPEDDLEYGFAWVGR